MFSQNFACPDCGISIDEIEPRSFSFNNPFGACPDCTGLGYKMEFDPELMIPDKSLSIRSGSDRGDGLAVSKRRRKFYQGDPGGALARNTVLTLIRPLRSIPRRSGISCCTERTGRK